MYALIIADQLPKLADGFSQLSQEADELHEEFHLTRRIIQGQSAAYLLHRVGNRSLNDELEQTLDRVAEWVTELADAVRSRADRNILARRMKFVVADLLTAQNEISSDIRLAATSPVSDPLAHVRRAHDRLEKIFAFTSLGNIPTSEGCAQEINYITAIRSN